MSPMRSETQRRWMWANKPEMAKRWEKETPEGKLPEHVPREEKPKPKPRRHAPTGRRKR